MYIRIFLIVTLFNLSFLKLNAQPENEELYLFNAKRLALSKRLHHRDSLINRIERLKWVKLNSKGFDDVLFYMVYDSVELIDFINSGLNTDSLGERNLLFGYCEFVFAINSKTKNTYRLKGYDFIDFVDFYNAEILDYKLGRKFTKKDIVLNFNIDRVDLECLYERFIISKRKQIECDKCIDKNKPIIIN